MCDFVHILELGKTQATPHFCVAYALCELGELMVETNRHADARAAWAEAKLLKGYHWEKLLAARIGADLDRLAKKEKGDSAKHNLNVIASAPAAATATNSTK
jgi:uncharacterized membrane protein YcjF (UPF0283 family)